MADELTALGEPVTLVGHSMGGKVAMLVALHRPELLHALVVVDVAPVEYPEVGRRSDDPAEEASPFAAFIAAMRAVDLSALGSREDAAFGPILSLGLEGIPSELLGDTVYRVPPLTTVDASAMVRDLKAAPVLFGRHGARGVHVAGIEDLLHRVAQLADAIPQLASVTLSPCIASLDTVSVLGARVLIAPTADRNFTVEGGVGSFDLYHGGFSVNSGALGGGDV